MDKIITDKDIEAKLYSNDTIEDKISFIKNSNIEKYSNIVKTIEMLEKTIGNSVENVDMNKATNMFGHLLDLISEILNTEDYNVFKIRFTILNMMFYLYKDSSCSDIKLCSFDYNWKRSEDELKTYLKLVVTIHMLCDPKTRARNLKLINFNNIDSGGKLTPTAYINLNKFYTE